MTRAMAVLCAAAVLLTAADADARRRGKKGALALTCSEKGAKVTVNNRSRGTTPLKQLALNAGTYTIKVKKLGYLDFSEKVKIKAGKTVTVMADLLPFAGVIAVKANVPKAKVLVDGRGVGKTPLEREVKLGRHTVTVRAPGYADFTAEINADPGNTYTINATLSKGSGGGDMDLALAPIGGGGGDELALAPIGGGGGGDDLALAPLPGLEPLGGDAGDELALAPIGGGGGDGMTLPGLEPLGGSTEISAVDPSLMSPTGGSGLTATVEKPTPWYMEWWVWTIAGAVVVGGVTTAVLVGRGGGGEDTRPEADYLWRIGEDQTPGFAYDALSFSF